jgi:hypothetical protein
MKRGLIEGGWGAMLFGGYPAQFPTLASSGNGVSSPKQTIPQLPSHPYSSKKFKTF